MGHTSRKTPALSMCPPVSAELGPASLLICCSKGKEPCPVPTQSQRHTLSLHRKAPTDLASDQYTLRSYTAPLPVSSSPRPDTNHPGLKALAAARGRAGPRQNPGSHQTEVESFTWNRGPGKLWSASPGRNGHVINAT